MSVSKELMMAILSMDAYDRGYDAALTLEGATKIDAEAFVEC